MNDAQSTILYLLIFPIISMFIFAIVDTLIEEYNNSKKQIWSYRKQFRKQNEEIEKLEFLEQIKK